MAENPDLEKLTAMVKNDLLKNRDRKFIVREVLRETQMDRQQAEDFVFEVEAQYGDKINFRKTAKRVTRGWLKVLGGLLMIACPVSIIRVEPRTVLEMNKFMFFTFAGGITLCTLGIYEMLNPESKRISIADSTLAKRITGGWPQIIAGIVLLAIPVFFVFTFKIVPTYSLGAFILLGVLEIIVGISELKNQKT